MIGKTSNRAKIILCATVFSLFALTMVMVEPASATTHEAKKTSSFTDIEPKTSGSNTCTGFSLTNDQEYACAVGQEDGTINLLAKAHGLRTTVTSEVKLNKDDRTPELTTDAKKVTFTAEFDMKGEIIESDGKQQLAFLTYGLEIYREHVIMGYPIWWQLYGDDGNCSLMKSASFTGKETVECSINNPEENTYRIAGFVKAVAQDNYLNFLDRAPDPTYVDFSIQNGNYIKLKELKIAEG